MAVQAKEPSPRGEKEPAKGNQESALDAQNADQTQRTFCSTAEWLSAVKKAGEKGDVQTLDQLGSDESFRRLSALAQREAEGSVGLAEALQGKPQSAENDALWLNLLRDLNPGPYSQYMFKMLGRYAEADGPVRELLLATQAAWNSKYGNNSAYNKDLQGIDRILSI